MILNRAPVEKGASLQSLRKALVDEPPTKFPSGAPTESDVHPCALLPISFWIPRKEPSLTAPAKREDAPFLEPSNYLLKFSAKGLPRFASKLLQRGTPSPELFSTPFPQSPQ